MPSGVAYVAAWGGVWRLVALLSAETCAWAGAVTGCCWRLHPPSGDKCFSPSMDHLCSPAPVVVTMVWLPSPPHFPASVGCVAGPRAGCVISSWSVLISVRMGLDGVILGDL